MSGCREFEAGIWLVEASLPEFDVRGALVEGRQRAVVWDTLSHPRDVSCLRPLVQDRELIIVYSHADWDHVWGTAGLPYEGTPIVA